MFYGNSAIVATQENKTGVWDANYSAVYHMADNAANTNVTDSTTKHPAKNQVDTTPVQDVDRPLGGSER
jgi:hypothetical protein